MEGLSGVFSRIQEIESQFAAPPVPALPVDPAVFDHMMKQQETPAAPPSATLPGGPSSLQPAFNPAMLPMSNLGNSATQQQIVAAAQSMDGKQYWPNACAHAVNDALTSVGVDISNKVNGNPNWVPNYANLGEKIDKMDDLKPGDLIVYNNYLGQGGYDHIGIYAGDGEAWNVSTAAGHKWVKSAIGNRFQEGHRLAKS